MTDLQKEMLKRALGDIADVQIDLTNANDKITANESWRYLYRIRLQLSEFIEYGRVITL